VPDPVEEDDVAQADLYFLGFSSAEQQRLQQQADEFAAESAWLFDQVGLQAGSRAVELGCGPQGCLELLAHRVGPTGSVIGVEINEQAALRSPRLRLPTRGCRRR
jgi:trans-aconitate methyltransferase